MSSKTKNNIKRKWAARQKKGRAAETKVLAALTERIGDHPILTEVPVMWSVFGSTSQRADFLIPTLGVVGEIKAATTAYKTGKTRIAHGSQEVTNYISGVYSRGMRGSWWGVVVSGDMRLWGRAWIDGIAQSPRWKEREWEWLTNLAPRSLWDQEDQFWTQASYAYRNRVLLNWCTECEDLVPPTDFYKKGGARPGLRAVCKPCYNRRERNYQNPSK